MSDFPNIPQIKPEVEDTFLSDQNKITEDVGVVGREAAGGGGTLKRKKLRRVLGIIGLTFLVFFAATSVLGFNTYKKGMRLKNSAQALVEAGKKQDLTEINKSLDRVERDLKSFDKAYGNLTYLRVFPIVGSYMADGKHFINAGIEGIEAGKIVLNAIEPYADIIGFAGGGKSESPDE